MIDAGYPTRGHSRQMRWGASYASLLLILLSTILSCTFGGTEKVDLVVLEAGSLVIPFAEIEKEFEKGHPNIDVKLEGHGSIQVIRHITEIHDEVDVAAVADYSLLPLLMYPVELPDGSGPYANWAIRFASNRLGIAYAPRSAYGDEINEDNWYEILSRSDVSLGLSDPRLDACGYRALMLIQLAESYYGNSTIFDTLISHSFSALIRVSEEEGVTTITVPEVLQPDDERIHLRGFSVQLLNLLQADEIDYAFQYESVAKQHGLRFLELPPQIDLSAEDLADVYNQVRVRLEFRRFKSVTPEFEGRPIFYGVTIPRNAPHPREAVEFLEFLLGPEGQRVLLETDQPPLVPPECDHKGEVPAELRPLLE